MTERWWVSTQRFFGILHFAPRKFGEDVTPIFDEHIFQIWVGSTTNYTDEVFFFRQKTSKFEPTGLFRAHRIHGTGIRYINLLHEWLICNGKCRER